MIAARVADPFRIRSPRRCGYIDGTIDDQSVEDMMVDTSTLVLILKHYCG